MRTIDADKLKQHYAWWNYGNADFMSKKKIFDDIVDLQPTVEIERTGNTVTMTSKKFLELIEKTVRPRGHWIGIEYDGYADGNPVYHLWECSVCEFEVEAESSYCPCCGSQMVEEEE